MMHELKYSVQKECRAVASHDYGWTGSIYVTLMTLVSPSITPHNALLLHLICVSCLHTASAQLCDSCTHSQTAVLEHFRKHVTVAGVACSGGTTVCRMTGPAMMTGLQASMHALQVMVAQHSESISHYMRASESCRVSTLKNIGCSAIGCRHLSRHLSKQVWYQFSLDIHCELGLAVTWSDMLQSKSTPCIEPATAMTVPCVCVLVQSSLLYDIMRYQSSDVALSLKPSVSNVCHVHVATSLLSSFADVVTDCSIAE